VSPGPFERHGNDKNPLTACAWPQLDEPYGVALQEAAEFLFSRFDVVAIIACGSIVRGNPHPGSDLDIYVIRGELERQRIQKCFNGVPAELFVNPLSAVYRYFREERACGRPCTAHMLTTGHLVYDTDSIGARLLGEAQRQLALLPDLPAETLQMRRYFAADLFDNARDMLVSDPDTAQVFLNEAVQLSTEFLFLNANRHLPRPKERLTVLDSWQPTVGNLIRAYYRAPDMATRWQAAERIAADVLGVTGFFEWESHPEKVEAEDARVDFTDKDHPGSSF